MALYCDLPGESYWNNAQSLLFNATGSHELPHDVWAECSACDHVGWRWLVGAQPLCQVCRATRLRAMRLAQHIVEQPADYQGDETPSKATRDSP